MNIRVLELSPGTRNRLSDEKMDIRVSRRGIGIAELILFATATRFKQNAVNFSPLLVSNSNLLFAIPIVLIEELCLKVKLEIST